MTGYRPEDLRNDDLVARVRAQRAACGRVAVMDVEQLGGGMIRERSEARAPAIVRRAPPEPTAALRSDIAELKAAVAELGRGQGWLLMATIGGFGVMAAAIVAVGILT